MTDVPEGRRDGVPHKSTEMDPRRLRSEDFLPFAELLLNFTSDPFALAFGFQIGLARHPSNPFFEVAFHLVKIAIRFVLGALPNGFSPFAQFDLRVAATSRLVCAHFQIP